MSNDKPYNDLIGDILNNYSKGGGMENLKGQGKPLSKEYFSGDTFQHFQRIASDAGYKPHWLKLQHEIRDEIILVSEAYSSNSTIDLEPRIDEINKKIYEHNKSCPPPLQKGTVSLRNLEGAIERWK
jgi:hypothetical protein